MKMAVTMQKKGHGGTFQEKKVFICHELTDVVLSTQRQKTRRRTIYSPHSVSEECVKRLTRNEREGRREVVRVSVNIFLDRTRTISMPDRKGVMSHRTKGTFLGHRQRVRTIE